MTVSFIKREIWTEKQTQQEKHPVETRTILSQAQNLAITGKAWNRPFSGTFRRTMVALTTTLSLPGQCQGERKKGPRGKLSLTLAPTLLFLEPRKPKAS
jgi:hypothetical protein